MSNLIKLNTLTQKSIQIFSFLANHLMGNHTHKHKHDHSHHHHTSNEIKHDNNHQQAPKPQSTKTQRVTSPDELDMPQFGGIVHIDKVKKVFVKYIKLLEHQFQFAQKILKKRLTLQHPNFITVRNYSYQPIEKHPELDTQSGLGSYYFCYPETKVVKLQFQPAILHVNGLIKSYCKQRKPIQEQEIRRIMRGVVECLMFLKCNDTYHGDIKPTTIFIHPKTRDVKLVDSFFFNNGKSAYEIVNENPKSESFLTPQQLEKKKTKQCDSMSSIYQSEVFCIGLTLIEMMTFESSMQAYNLELLEINKDFLPRKFVQMQQYGYSFQLSDLALRCIHKDPSKRPKFEEIMRNLK